MSADIPTFNLSDSGDGMVPLNNNNNNQTTSFVPKMPEKNVGENKDMMDSTPIADIMGQPQDMMEPPSLSVDPRMIQQQVMVPPPPTTTMSVSGAETKEKKGKKNPFDLTDEQLHAVLVAACTAAAISKPVQEKLASTIPQFLNTQGNRSLVGLASTGAVAAIVFFIVNRYF
jgi:hypothetical protein